MTERAGWIGFVFGLLVGMALVALLIEPAPSCQEDEVAMWPMEAGRFVGHVNTDCVPIDDL